MGLFSSVGHIVGGLTGAGAADAAKDAARAQEEAIRKAMAQYNTDYAGQQQLFNPFINSGAQGLSGLNALNSGDFSGFQNSPDFQYALQQGLAGVDSRAGAMGNLFSGARVGALNDKAQGLASQNLGNYRNALMGQIGIGQWGTGGLSNQLWNKTQGIADAQLGIGNVRAGGQVGAANAWANGAANLVNLGTSVFGGSGNGSSGGGGFGDLFKNALGSAYGTTQQGSMSPNGILTSNNSGYNPYYPE